MRQCKACPWRTDVVPEEDIPGGYCKTKHKKLKSTIAKPGDVSSVFSGGGLTMMACHETTGGDEKPCVGWLANQLGPGNNLALRMWALDNLKERLDLVGEQHRRFEDTLPQDAQNREGAKKDHCR
jgi:hypothetical protein